MSIPGPTVGTWPIDNTGAVTVAFSCAAGTAFQTATQNTWVAGNFLAATGVSNLFTGARSFYFTDVGLYLDADATGKPPRYEMPDEAQEQNACQRYFMWGLF